jgi:hypothetical protein
MMIKEGCFWGLSIMRRNVVCGGSTTQKKSTSQATASAFLWGCRQTAFLLNFIFKKINFYIVLMS